MSSLAASIAAVIHHSAPVACTVAERWLGSSGNGDGSVAPTPPQRHRSTTAPQHHRR